MKAKSQVLKKQKPDVKAAKKAKLFSVYDWVGLVRDDMLQKLYVSQLDLYLKQSGYSYK